MARISEDLYGSRDAVRRNGAIVVASSVFLYILAVVLGAMGGWGAAFPVLLVAVVVDAFCIAVRFAFRSAHRS
ncbi:hypothetical protein [Streptomyces sp. NPDC001770]